MKLIWDVIVFIAVGIFTLIMYSPFILLFLLPGIIAIACFVAGSTGAIIVGVMMSLFQFGFICIAYSGLRSRYEGTL